MEIYLIIILFIVVMFLAIVAFINNRVVSKNKASEFERRMTQLEKENDELKQKLDMS